LELTSLDQNNISASIAADLVPLRQVPSGEYFLKLVLKDHMLVRYINFSRVRLTPFGTIDMKTSKDDRTFHKRPDEYDD
jgi:hypothetical protein